MSKFRFNSRKPYYNDDSDYTTNAPSYYDDLARKNQLIKYLAKRIWEYEKTLHESLEEIENILNNYIDVIDGKIEVIDHLIGEGFNDVIEELLREWVDDGTLDHIINEEIFSHKLDTERYEKGLQHLSYKMFEEEGLTDSEVIRRTHEKANELGIKVVNLSGEYWLEAGDEIPIETDVDWGNTVFHIDESLESGNHFSINPSREEKEVLLSLEDKRKVVEKLKKGVQRIPELKDYANHLIIVEDENTIGARRSFDGGVGSVWNLEEHFYVGNGGEIVGDIKWNFNDYTKMTAIYCEDSYLTIKGGTFLLNGKGDSNSESNFTTSGIGIYRSRVIIKDQFIGIEEGETDDLLAVGLGSSGFYNYHKVYDLTFENIRGLPRKVYPGYIGGSYGFEGSRVVNLKFYNVVATGEIGEYYGITGQNKIKNMIVKDSIINRIDCHFDLTNLTVKNSKIGVMQLNGGGDLIIKDCVTEGNYIVTMRGDYGGSWDGNITIDNVRHISKNLTSLVLRFIRNDFDYGYELKTGNIIKLTNITFDYVNYPNNVNRPNIFYQEGSGISVDDRKYKMFKELIMENIKIINHNNKDFGFRATNIYNLHNLECNTEGGYSKDETTHNQLTVNTNTYIKIKNVDLNNPTGTLVSSTHSNIVISVELTSHLNSMDEFSPYIKLVIEDCENVQGVFRQAPMDITINNCSIKQFIARQVSGGGLRTTSNAIVTLNNCKVKPEYIKDVEDPANDELGSILLGYSNFINNTEVYPVIYDGSVDVNKSLKSNGIFEYDHDIKGVLLSLNIANNIYLSYDLLKIFRDNYSPLHAKAIEQLLKHANANQYRQFINIGTTEYRPVISDSDEKNYGHCYFDMDLRKPIWWAVSKWVDGSGEEV